MTEPIVTFPHRENMYPDKFEYYPSDEVDTWKESGFRRLDELEKEAERLQQEANKYQDRIVYSLPKAIKAKTIRDFVVEWRERLGANQK